MVLPLRKIYKPQPQPQLHLKLNINKKQSTNDVTIKNWERRSFCAILSPGVGGQTPQPEEQPENYLWNMVTEAKQMSEKLDSSKSPSSKPLTISLSSITGNSWLFAQTSSIHSSNQCVPSFWWNRISLNGSHLVNRFGFTHELELRKKSKIQLLLNALFMICEKIQRIWWSSFGGGKLQHSYFKIWCDFCKNSPPPWEIFTWKLGQVELVHHGSVESVDHGAARKRMGKNGPSKTSTQSKTNRLQQITNSRRKWRKTCGLL